MQIAKESYDSPLDDQRVVGCHHDRLHRAVCRLQTVATALFVKTLERSRLIDQGDYYLAIFWRRIGLDYDKVTVIDAILDHRLSLDLKGITA